MSEPRRHHFVPASYLAGFTAPTKQLHVIGVNGKRWVAWPRDICFKRDLYRVEGIEGIQPNDFEKDFALLEGSFIDLVRSIDQTAQLPPRGSKSFGTLMTYIALLAVRGPGHRAGVEATVLRLAGEAEDALRKQSPEEFAAWVEQARSEGLKIPDDPDALQAARQLPRGAFTIAVPNTWFMQALFRGVERLQAALYGLSWTIHAGAREFVTCDRPVGITGQDSATPVRRLHSELIPQRGIVTFPLNRRFLVVGERLEIPDVAQATMLDTRAVASMNSRTISMANQFICWSGEEMVWMARTNAVQGAADLLSAMRELAETRRG